MDLERALKAGGAVALLVGCAKAAYAEEAVLSDAIRVGRLCRAQADRNPEIRRFTRVTSVPPGTVTLQASRTKAWLMVEYQL